MSTHTPGPWEVRHESADPCWAVVCALGGRIVANVNSETGPDIPPLVSIKMPTDANARLIAAAPDLLEAAKRLLENADDRDETHDEETGEEYNDWKDLRDAIAKAEGK